MEATLTSSLGRTTLSSSTLSIGRASDNQLVIDDAQASAHHAEIKLSLDGATYLVTDQSSNGTFVNGERLPIHTPCALNAGDIIRIGNLDFTYEMAGITNAYEPTIAVTPNAIANHIPDVLHPSPEPLATSTTYEQPDYPGQAYAQTEYSMPPSVAPQLVEPPRSKGLWITLALVAILVVGGGILGMLYNTNRSTPTKTLQTFCTDFKNGDAQGLYDLLSSHTQAQTTVEVLRTILGLVQGSGGVHDCTVSTIQEHGSTATGHLTITLNNAQSKQSTLEHLTNEKGIWKMDEVASQSPAY